MELAPLYVGDESLIRFSIGDGESGLKKAPHKGLKMLSPRQYLLQIKAAQVYGRNGSNDHDIDPNDMGNPLLDMPISNMNKEQSPLKLGIIVYMAIGQECNFQNASTNLKFTTFVFQVLRFVYYPFVILECRYRNPYFH